MVPMTAAYSVTLPRCQSAVIGINSQDPSAVYSPQCESRNERILECECPEDVIELYSNPGQEHDIRIQYTERDGVKKLKDFSNLQLRNDYVNKQAFDIAIRFVAGLIFVPLILVSVISYLIHKERKKNERD